MQDDEDRAAILDRRRRFLRREVLLGAISAPISASAACLPCLETLPPSRCAPDADFPVQSSRWTRLPYSGELVTATSPLFEGDRPIGGASSSATSLLSSTSPSAALTAEGAAAIDDLAVVLKGAPRGSVALTISGSPCAPGAACVDGGARAQTVRDHLASRGAAVQVTGSGSAAPEQFQMTLLIVACGRDEPKR